MDYLRYWETLNATRQEEGGQQCRILLYHVCTCSVLSICEICGIKTAVKVQLVAFHRVNILISQGCMCDFMLSLCSADLISDKRFEFFQCSKVSPNLSCIFKIILTMKVYFVILNFI